MKTVYIVNLTTGYHYNKAKVFGELVYITKGHIDIDNTDVKALYRSMIESASPDDYLVLSGGTLLCVIVTDLWKSIHGRCNILKWDFQNQTYTPYVLSG